MFENYVQNDLGYKEFKISVFNDYNCKLLWNDDSVEQLCYHAMKNGRIDLYIDHACDNEEVYDDGSSENDSDYKEESGDSSETGEGGESGEDNDIEDYIRILLTVMMSLKKY